MMTNEQEKNCLSKRYHLSIDFKIKSNFENYFINHMLSRSFSFYMEIQHNLNCLV